MRALLLFLLAVWMLPPSLAQGQEYQTREQLLQHMEEIHHPQKAMAAPVDAHARMDADHDGRLTREEWEAFMAGHDEDYLPCHRAFSQEAPLPAH